jgi:hypothetical protein
LNKPKYRVGGVHPKGIHPEGLPARKTNTSSFPHSSLSPLWEMRMHSYEGSGRGDRIVSEIIAYSRGREVEQI